MWQSLSSKLTWFCWKQRCCRGWQRCSTAQRVWRHCSWVMQKSVTSSDVSFNADGDTNARKEKRKTFCRYVYWVRMWQRRILKNTPQVATRVGTARKFRIILTTPDIEPRTWPSDLRKPLNIQRMTCIQVFPWTSSRKYRKFNKSRRQIVFPFNWVTFSKLSLTPAPHRIPSQCHPLLCGFGAKLHNAW